MRSMHEIVADVEMIRQAKTIREWLCNLSGLIPRLNERPNPYYGTTLDGLVLIHCYGGPSSIGTPFGEWSCTGGGCLENPGWFDEAKERLEALFLLEKRVDGLRDGADPVDIIGGEDRHVVDHPLDRDEFGGADRFVRGRDRHHHGDQRILRGERGQGVGHGTHPFKGYAVQIIDDWPPVQ